MRKAVCYHAYSGYYMMPVFVQCAIKSSGCSSVCFLFFSNFQDLAPQLESGGQADQVTNRLKELNNKKKTEKQKDQQIHLHMTGTDWTLENDEPCKYLEFFCF